MTDQSEGGIYSVGYNAWKGHDGLSRMFDALESEGVTILVDTRNSDYRARYSFDQLAAASKERGIHHGEFRRNACGRREFLSAVFGSAGRSADLYESSHRGIY